MNRCRRVGLDVTKRCNWRCHTCFYRWKPDFNAKFDRPLGDVMGEVRVAQKRGCNHAVIVGWGEPMLWPPLLDWVKACKTQGMTTSIITNGTGSPRRYAQLYEAGLNHLHVSVHGLGETLDRVAGVPGAGRQQAKALDWLGDSKLPWRMNMTVQRANHTELPKIARHCLDRGCRHIVALGFLPHYEWNDPTKLREVAVDPRELEPYLAMTAAQVELQNAKDFQLERNDPAYIDGRRLFTIRYHPLCCLADAYRRYVVNARFVLYDPWEWDYGNAGASEDQLWAAALSLGDSVATQGPPCSECLLLEHCGGWNRTYAQGFPGCLEGGPLGGDHKPRAFYHDRNPANHAKGWF